MCDRMYGYALLITRQIYLKISYTKKALSACTKTASLIFKEKL